jgi:hypothetical protein
MSEEIHEADWSIPYPGDMDENDVAAVLLRVTDVEYEWDAFPWHLVTRLVDVLENPAASFEYLHLTSFFRARAAMLALKGNVLDHRDLHASLSRHEVQVGGIYRKHLLSHAGEHLEKHDLTRLPPCHGEDGDSTDSGAELEGNRAVVRKVVKRAEAEYLKTLNFISVAAHMDEEVARHSVGFWVKGAEMPKRVGVRVRVRRHEGGHEVRPSEEDVKRMIKTDQPFGKIVVRRMAGGEGSQRTGGRDRKRGEQDDVKATLTPTLSPPREREKRGVAGWHGGAGEYAAVAVAQKAAEIVLAAVTPALRCSKLNPDRGPTDDLVQAYNLERKKHGTDGETFAALARLDIEMARKTPDKAPWLRLSEAQRHYSRAVRGESARADDIAARAIALERRYRRAIRDAQRVGAK